MKLEDHLQAQLDAVMQYPTAAKDLAEYFAAAKYDGYLDVGILKSIPSTCLAAQLISTHIAMLNPKHKDIYAVLYKHQGSRFLKIPAISKGLNYEGLEANVIKRYPLLGAIFRSNVKTSNGVADYINLIEKDLCKKPS